MDDLDKHVLEQAKIEVDHTRSWPTKILAFYLATNVAIVTGLFTLAGRSARTVVATPCIRAELTTLVFALAVWALVLLARNHRSYQLRSRFERLRQRGMLTGEEMAQQLGVCSTIIHQLGCKGVLTRHLYGNNRRCLYEPPNGGQLVRGVGGRYGSQPARFIPAQPSTQGAI